MSEYENMIECYKYILYEFGIDVENNKYCIIENKKGVLYIAQVCRLDERKYTFLITDKKSILYTYMAYEKYIKEHKQEETKEKTR